MEEKNYDFRKRLLEVHKKNVRNENAVLQENELEIKDGFTIFVSETAGDCMITAVKDFVDFLFTSMKVSPIIKVGRYDGRGNAMVVALSSETGANLGSAASYRGYRIDTEKGAVFVHGFDERGAGQALYTSKIK